jgi:hypothetical protein
MHARVTSFRIGVGKRIQILPQLPGQQTVHRGWSLTMPESERNGVKGERTEFFTVSCQRKGKVSLDGSYLGENKLGGMLRVFECPAGLHDITLECLRGRRCRTMTQRIMITGTNGILPLRIRFVCEL